MSARKRLRNDEDILQYLDSLPSEGEQLSSDSDGENDDVCYTEVINDDLGSDSSDFEHVAELDISQEDSDERLYDPEPVENESDDNDDNNNESENIENCDDNNESENNGDNIDESGNTQNGGDNSDKEKYNENIHNF